MDLAFILFLIIKHIKVIILKIKNMDMEYFNGMMENNIKVGGWMENKMVLEYLFSKKCNNNKLIVKLILLHKR